MCLWYLKKQPQRALKERFKTPQPLPPPGESGTVFPWLHGEETGLVLGLRYLWWRWIYSQQGWGGDRLTQRMRLLSPSGIESQKCALMQTSTGVWQEAHTGETHPGTAPMQIHIWTPLGKRPSVTWNTDLFVFILSVLLIHIWISTPNTPLQVYCLWGTRKSQNWSQLRLGL